VNLIRHIRMKAGSRVLVLAALALLASAGLAWRAEPTAVDKDFVAAAQLETPPVPISAPELSRLEGVRLSGLPLRLRLFIDTSGRVIEARVLVGQEDDAVLAAVRAMFEATAFVPGRRGGAPVAAFTDIELAMNPEEP
jgi:hypothetical protein